jgi:hypothetical protein
MTYAPPVRVLSSTSVPGGPAGALVSLVGAAADVSLVVADAVAAEVDAAGALATGVVALACPADGADDVTPAEPLTGAAEGAGGAASAATRRQRSTWRL